MIDPKGPDLPAQLEAAWEAFRQADERATAGRLALELMHEIKNPLEALGHLTYLALQEADDAACVRKYMELAQEQMATLSQIVSQTLGFTRSSPGPKAIELANLVEAALRIHQRTIEAKGIHLVKDLPRDSSVEVHTSEILQVISNLIVNGLDALPAGGGLCLRLRRRRNWVELVIADNGVGIPAKNAEKIFNAFFTTKGEHGSGLGLSISRKIIERHNGKLRMRSSVRAHRSGTVFRISLPAKLDHAVEPKRA